MDGSLKGATGVGPDLQEQHRPVWRTSSNLRGNALHGIAIGHADLQPIWCAGVAVGVHRPRSLAFSYRLGRIDRTGKPLDGLFFRDIWVASTDGWLAAISVNLISRVALPLGHLLD
jgi:hypothetical protein